MGICPLCARQFIYEIRQYIRGGVGSVHHGAVGIPFYLGAYLGYDGKRYRIYGLYGSGISVGVRRGVFYFLRIRIREE